jgi:hypothetical protein
MGEPPVSKRENFYRRDPGLALAGMATMSLEERGVYNTILDLLYLTWRPLEDNPAYIAGHCMCAVQKLNPILNRLVEKGKLVRFIEGGQGYISNPAFDDEREAVKGPAKSRSGRRSREAATGQVEEKSAGVGEKSPGVEKNPPLLDTNSEENQSVAPLEKTRQDKTEAKASFVAGSDVQAAFALWNDLAGRIGLPVAKALTPDRRKQIKARLDPDGLDGWREALSGVEASRHCRGQNDRGWKADLDFVCQAKSYQRLREGTYGRDLATASAEPSPAAWSGPWQLRAAVVDVAGEDVARGYVDPAVWRAEDRALVVRNAFMADRLRREAGPTLDRLKVNIVVSEGVAA